MIIYISTIGRYVRAFEFGQCIPSTSTCILLPQLSSGFGETLPVAFASWDTSPTLPAGCKFQLSLSRLCGVLCSDARRAAYALEKLRTLLLCYSQYASDFRHLQTYLRDTLRGCWACSRLLRIDLLWFAESDWICSILFNSVQVSKSFRFSEIAALWLRGENWKTDLWNLVTVRLRSHRMKSRSSCWRSQFSTFCMQIPCRIPCRSIAFSPCVS